MRRGREVRMRREKQRGGIKGRESGGGGGGGSGGLFGARTVMDDGVD